MSDGQSLTDLVHLHLHRRSLGLRLQGVKIQTNPETVTNDRHMIFRKEIGCVSILMVVSLTF
jgi:hypothetical protein